MYLCSLGEFLIFYDKNVYKVKSVTLLMCLGLISFFSLTHMIGLFSLPANKYLLYAIPGHGNMVTNRNT